MIYLGYSFTHKPVNSESETALKHYQMRSPTEGSGAYLCVRLDIAFLSQKVILLTVDEFIRVCSW